MADKTQENTTSLTTLGLDEKILSALKDKGYEVCSVNWIEVCVTTEDG